MDDDASGAVVERYRYADFGSVTILAPDEQATRPASLFGNTRLFTGRELDTETGLYHYRRRAYDPSLGRFLQRDPLGLWGDELNLGNPLAYVGNGPWTWTDPWGLQQGYDLPELDARTKAGSLPRGTENRESNTNLLTPAQKEHVRTASEAQLAEWRATGAEMIKDSAILTAEVALALSAMGELEFGYLLARSGLKLTRDAATKACKYFLNGKEISPQEAARLLGELGEKAAAIVKNTRQIRSLTGTAKYRVPDVLDESRKLIGDVKNVAELAYTNQLKDYAAYAAEKGYRFELIVRENTKLSGPLQQAIDRKEIILKRILPPL